VRPSLTSALSLPSLQELVKHVIDSALIPAIHRMRNHLVFLLRTQAFYLVYFLIHITTKMASIDMLQIHHTS
jgi:hypothetical protein